MNDTVFEDPTSVTNIEQNNFSVYPVPAKTSITVSSKENYTDEVYFIEDVFGKKIRSGKLTGKATTIDIEDLSPGNYFIHLDSSESKTLRIIKS
jgi:hypothetical protein